MQLNFPMEKITYDIIDSKRKLDYLTVWQGWDISPDEWVIGYPVCTFVRCHLSYDPDTQTCTLTTNRPVTFQETPTHYLFKFGYGINTSVSKQTGEVIYPG